MVLWACCTCWERSLVALSLVALVRMTWQRAFARPLEQEVRHLQV